LNGYSQDKGDAVTTNVSKITFLGMGYEKSIGKNQSVNFRACMNAAGTFSYSSSFGNMSEFYFDPAIAIEYRYYYNLGKRSNRDKRTDMNSADYLAAVFQDVFSKRRISSSYYVEDNRRPIYHMGIVWGMQRNYKGRFSLDGNIGPGYLFTTGLKPDNTGAPIKENIGQFSVVWQFSVGFWLNKRK
jgi:hypothetical protein